MPMEPPMPSPARPAKISALISDVDGTLVTPDKVLTPRACAAVAALKARGIAFSLISSRPPRGMAMLIEPLGITAPIAAFNGGVIATPQLSRLEQHLLSPAAARRAVDFLTARGPEVWVFNGDDWLVREQGHYVARELRTVAFPPTVVTDFGRGLDAVGKIVAASSDPDLLVRCERDLQAILGADGTASRSQSYYLDVTHPRANKGDGVLALARRLGIPMGEVAVIGDGGNDVAMFEQSALSIAMKNGVPETRARADFITDSNEDEGFAKAVERYLLAAGTAAPAQG
jgi:Cof subfamily protein (haloacid dehalogenase superfamily)